MQETPLQDTQPVITQWNTIWYLSIGFLILVLVTIWGLYALIYTTKLSISKIEAEVSRINTSIQTVSQDRNIVIAKIIQENAMRPSIDLSNIVSQFRKAAEDANVSFDGFSIKDDTISTMLTATEATGTHPDPVSTIIDMMNKYSMKEQKFRLGSINTVSGDTLRRTTAIELQVITPPIQ